MKQPRGYPKPTQWLYASRLAFAMDGFLTPQQLENLRYIWEKNFPGKKLFILENGMKLGVINENDLSK
jgi:hypothetical protein